MARSVYDTTSPQFFVSNRKSQNRDFACYQVLNFTTTFAGAPKRDLNANAKHSIVVIYISRAVQSIIRTWSCAPCNLNSDGPLDAARRIVRQADRKSHLFSCPIIA